MGFGVMNVSAVRQGDEEIGVQQPDRAFQTSSSARFTSSRVIGFAPTGAAKTGKPLRFAVLVSACRPLRINSETTEPKDCDRWVAIWRAASNAAASISRVV